MMGQPFPEKATLDARLDPNGDPNNPMTHGPAGPSAVATGVAHGTRGLELVLKRSVKGGR